jgi:hypothetical protein
MMMMLIALLLLLCGADAAKLAWTKGNWTNGLIMGRPYVLEWTSEQVAAAATVTIRCYKSKPACGRVVKPISILTDSARANAVDRPACV